MFGFFFVRQKNFEKDEMYRKAFKSSDDGTLSTQPGNIRIISQCDKWWEGGERVLDCGSRSCNVRLGRIIL